MSQAAGTHTGIAGLWVLQDSSGLWWEQSLQQREQVGREILGSRQAQGEQADRGAAGLGVVAVTAHPLEVLLGRDKQDNGPHSVPTNGIPTNTRERRSRTDGAGWGIHLTRCSEQGSPLRSRPQTRLLLPQNQFLHCPAPRGL